jgi:hypothetical protein
MRTRQRMIPPTAGHGHAAAAETGAGTARDDRDSFLSRVANDAGDFIDGLRQDDAGGWRLERGGPIESIRSSGAESTRGGSRMAVSSATRDMELRIADCGLTLRGEALASMRYPLRGGSESLLRGAFFAGGVPRRNYISAAAQCIADCRGCSVSGAKCEAGRGKHCGLGIGELSS